MTRINCIGRALPAGLLALALSQPSLAEPPANCDRKQQHYLDWTQRYFDVAQLVFYGKVIVDEPVDRASRQPTNPDPATPRDDPGASSMSELLELIREGQRQASRQPDTQRATIEVTRAWKGPIKPKIDVVASMLPSKGGYHRAFETGQHYLVFAFKVDDDDYFVPVYCTSHESVKETASMMRVLDALTKEPGTKK